MGLLEDLARMTGCEYLSDLQFLRRDSLGRLLRCIPTERYPAEQWLDAEQYLGRGRSAPGKSAGAEKPAAIRGRLLEQLEQR